MSIQQQAQRLGFPIAGELKRCQDREPTRRDRIYQDAEGNLYLVYRGILTIVSADGTVY